MDTDVEAKLPLSLIDRVVFYKRDELTSDLICCDVELEGKTWTFHEELPSWDALLRHVGKLPGFNCDWFELVAMPAFEANGTVAFSRAWRER